jgi:hypothetical protein
LPHQRRRLLLHPRRVILKEINQAKISVKARGVGVPGFLAGHSLGFLNTVEAQVRADESVTIVSSRRRVRA